MTRFLIMRLVSAVPVLIFVSLLSFLIVLLVPGDIISILVSPSASADEIARLRTQLGLDLPAWERVANWYWNILRGDLGYSLRLHRGVTEAIVERLPVTLSLTLGALVMTLVIGIIAGVIAAMRANTWVDQAVMSTALFGLSLPDFWLGLVMIFVISVQLGWLPTGGYVALTTDPLGWLRFLAMPAGVLALTQVGLLARMTRSSMLDVLRQDFIRTAWAKGLPGKIVIGKHALANVMIPVITVAGISLGILLSGAIVVEQVFALPGVGQLIVGSIAARDYPVIQGGLLFTTVIFVFVNILVDVLYALVDPRVRYER